MPSYLINPTGSGAYDVTITDPDGSDRVMRALPDMLSALEWICAQRKATGETIDTLSPEVVPDKSN